MNFSGSYDKAELYQIPKYQVLLNSMTQEAIFCKKNNNFLVECTNIFLNNLSSNTAEKTVNVSLNLGP